MLKKHKLINLDIKNNLKILFIKVNKVKKENEDKLKKYFKQMFLYIKFNQIYLKLNIYIL